MQAIAIILLSIASAVGYGIVHDQITARICIEYFTIGHPRLIDSESPSVLGLFWGVAATWWVGLPLGVGLAIAARAGRRPKLDVAHLVRPILGLLGCALAIAAIAGVIGFATAEMGVFELIEPLASRVPRNRHTVFLADGWAHGGSYLAGSVGGIVLCVRTWRRRATVATNAERSAASNGGPATQFGKTIVPGEPPSVR